MISIIVPVCNEEEGLEYFFDSIHRELKYLKEDFELIFIDDGSIDSSLEILKGFEKNNFVRVFSLRKNRGKSEALTLGFLKAKGRYVITIDADLQEDPKSIHDFIKILDENKYDAVSGWRKNRKDKKKMVFISRIFNKLIHSIWGVNIHDYNCGFKAYTNEAVKSLNLYGGMHRFIPLILSSEGFRITEIEVSHRPRKFGKSKYTFAKIFKDIPDMLSMLFLNRYSRRPLHFFATFGFVMIIAGTSILVYLTILHFQGERIGTRPLLLFGVLLELSGLQAIFTGFLADLIINNKKLEFNLRYESK